MTRSVWGVLGIAGVAFGSAALGQDVTIVSPPVGEALFGEIEISAEVTSVDPIDRVEFIVDGRLVSTLTAPPYRTLADLGHSNAEHRIRVRAYTNRGQWGEDVRKTSTIRVDDNLDVELRQLYVTATRQGRRVLDLREEEFVIRDEGERQEIITFSHGEVPLTAVLLLDCSASMAGDRLEAALAGTRVFLDGMHELDEAKIVLFSDRLLGTSPFSSDPSQLHRSLTTVEPVGGTAVNDFLYAGLKLLDSRQGRRVVVLFTDGADVHSVLRVREVLWKARRSQAMIFWISLRETFEQGQDGAKFNSAWRPWQENVEEFDLLAKVVTESGGRVEVVDRASDLEEAFSALIAELRSQYVLGYYPSDSAKDGRWHRVEVDARRPGVRVRAREGYVDQ